jgi:hypothetical protein
MHAIKCTNGDNAFFKNGKLIQMLVYLHGCEVIIPVNIPFIL